MDVLGVGVLLTGPSGIGKSELALGLIHLGHCLIADDAVIFTLNTENAVIGSCPALLQDFLEVRGLGILNIRIMFGDTAIKQSKRIQLIVDLILLENEKLLQFDRLHGVHTTLTIHGVAIPQVTIPVAPGRNLAILVECAVRNHILKTTGYDATQEFIARHNAIIESPVS